MRSTMLRARGKCCPGTIPPANHRLIFLSQSRPELLCKMKCPVISLDNKSFPKEFHHRVPSVLGREAGWDSPCSTTAQGNLGSGGQWCWWGSKTATSTWRGEVNSNLRTSSVVRTVQIPMWIYFLCSDLWDSVFLMYWFANILMPSCSLYMLYKGIECYISM